jgi:selenide, water dikinase
MVDGGVGMDGMTDELRTDTGGEAREGPVRLTQTVKKGGCAAKIGAGTLSDLLRTLPRPNHPDLMVGTDLLDDAAVWRVRPDLVAVQTLDFFTPILDDPTDFGAVAAANALSDVFAMGATPSTALTILAYPLDTLPLSVLGELMRGAVAVIEEAGAALVGGHSIEDDTLKLGFAVTGFAHPDRLWTNQGARPGDILILTKAVGTGTLAGALKNGEIGYDDMAEAIASMRQVNRLDLPADLHAAVHAATDVTGFGILGHAKHLAEGSGVRLRIDPASVPLLAGASETLRRGILTKAHTSNTRYVQAHVQGREALDEVAWLSLVDPQTSGGLLLSVAPDAAERLLDVVRQRFPRAVRIGEVLGSIDRDADRAVAAGHAAGAEVPPSIAVA